jgi:hypothetical protein
MQEASIEPMRLAGPVIGMFKTTRYAGRNCDESALVAQPLSSAAHRNGAPQNMRNLADFLH